ncbi:unnamed protein product [Cuscuta campestris]|uniref:Glycosyltransferase n=1 Tax=Cuscuta campestris TaxID=132261 RepID=A0A484NQ94_9ASTE|nr:unnamed protein product [Cuscuta campestris]
MERSERESGVDERGEGRVVVLVPYPLQGHMTPLLQLGHALHSKGFSVKIAHTQYNPPTPSHHPNLSFHNLAEGDDIPSGDVAERLIFAGTMNENCRVPLREYLEKLGDDVRCVIYDNLMYYAGHVASLLRLPSIVMRPFSALFALFVVHLLRHGDSVFPVPEYKLEDSIPELDLVRYKDIPSFMSSREAKSFMSMSTDIGSSVAIIWNTVEGLEHKWLSRLQQLYKVPIFPTGPFHKFSITPTNTSFLEEDRSCLSWLDKQAPQSVLFVSASGSIAEIEEGDFAEIAWGLADSGHSFLWAIRPGSIKGMECEEGQWEDLERRMGERGRIVKWAPQKDVLAHGSVGGFWSHCGWNSTMEALGEGVPMICRPVFADQLTNARFLVQEWRVGLELKELERGVIAKTVKELMREGDERDKVKKNAMGMKRKLDDSFKRDGSSHRALNELAHFISSLPRCELRL